MGRPTIRRISPRVQRVFTAFKKVSSRNTTPPRHPKPATTAVGGVPVLLVVQRPGELNAHGVALAALGKVISHNDEHDAHHQLGDQGHIHFHPQRIEVNCAAGKDGDDGAAPQDQLIHLILDILPLGVHHGAEGAQQMYRHQKGRQAENGKSFGGPSVRHAVDIKMGGDGLRQAGPEGKAQQNGQSGNDGSEDQGPLISFQHGPFLLSIRKARASLPPPRRCSAHKK